MSHARQLLDATPLPPVTDDVDVLVAAFEAMHARRQTILDALARPIAIGEADRPLVRELELRNRAWLDTLVAALARVGAQRRSIGKLRAYACVESAGL